MAKIFQWITVEAAKTNIWVVAPKKVLKSQKHQLRASWSTPEVILIMILRKTRKLSIQVMFLRNPKSKHFPRNNSQLTSKMSKLSKIINYKVIMMMTTMKRTTQKTKTRSLITRSNKPN